MDYLYGSECLSINTSACPTPGTPYYTHLRNGFHSLAYISLILFNIYFLKNEKFFY